MDPSSRRRPRRSILGGSTLLAVVILPAAGFGSTTAYADTHVVLRPNGDVVRQWTGTAGGAWAAVDDDIVQPSRVEHNDFIYGSRPDRVTEMYITDHPLNGGTAASTLWFYANTGPSTRLLAEAISRGNTIASITVPKNQGYAWRSIQTPELNQLHLDDLRIRLTVLDGGDSNVRAVYAELPTITPPPPPQPPVQPPPPSTRPNDRSLATFWAPYIMQRTAPTKHWDYLASVDYDGDWDTTNNWENVEQREKLKGAAYYSVVETASHWYLLYAFYHPRDWESQDGLLADPDKHENDMEGVLLTVKRDGSPTGTLQGAVTVAHNDFFSYTPPGGELSNGIESIDGELLVMPMIRGGSILPYRPPIVGPPRAVIDIDPKSHAVHAAKKTDWTDPVSGKYRFGPQVEYWPGAAGQVPNDVRFAKPDYELVDIFAPNGLWEHRNCPTTFFKYGVFRGYNYRNNKANAPWRWDDHNDSVTPGAMATNPARLMLWYHKSRTPFDQQYTYNPYNNPAPEVC